MTMARLIDTIDDWLCLTVLLCFQWNPVEKEWDCPCHGSCFDKKGKQLSGPATTDMRPPQIITE